MAAQFPAVIQTEIYLMISNISDRFRQLWTYRSTNSAKGIGK